MTNKNILLLLVFFALTIPQAFSKVYYVGPDGNDLNPGTAIGSPLVTIQKAQEYVNPGDTVYIRGGTYMMSESQIAKEESIWAYVTNLDKSGTAGKRINYWAYPGETPVFDYSNVKPANLRVIAFYVTGSWIYIKGLEITGVQVTILTHTQSECFENQGSNNIYERLVMHDGQAIGIYCLKGSNNLFLNCDAYQNHDYTSENGLGGNTDGFGCHVPKGNTGNVFRGCRAWFNSDDGFDCINNGEPVIFENCWAFYNGYSTSFASLGDGNGFKAGGYGSTDISKLPNPIPSNTVRFCLAVRNKANGFYSNHHLNGSNWYNNSAYKNAVNYNMLNRDSVTPTGYLRDVDGYNHVLKNNLGYLARSKELDKINLTRCTHENNYFDLTVTVAADDFLSPDESLLTAPRKADGSLPDIDFMRLKPGSDLTDKGVDIGFPFLGAAPDLGAFEFDPARFTYALHVLTEGSGSVSLEPNGGSYFSGTAVTAVATPEAGWTFYNWSGDVTGTDSTITISMDTVKTITANFSKINTSVARKTSATSLTCYPDPAHGNVTVNFSLSEQSLVNISLFNISGKKEKAIVNREFSAGSKTIQFNTSGLTPGIYVLKMVTSQDTLTKRVIVK